LGITFSFRINLFLHIINLVFSLFDQFKKKELETERLKKAQLEQEVQLLREQMNPHFLFNNLNVLSALLLKEDKNANEFLEKFAEVYRHVLKVQKTDLISLKEELQLLDAYLYLLHHRFPEALEIDIRIAPSLLQSKIVPMTLQILLENVVKHNQVHASNPIQVRIATEGDKLIKIANKIKPKTVDNISSNGIGLNSIEKRYKLVSSQPIGIRHDDEVFEVELPVIF
jgi:LytS/YehU family sensor histidine kinase